MERKKTRIEKEPARALSENDLTQVSGGVGYASIRCKKCGKEFTDLDQYKRHVETGCGNAAAAVR